MLFINPEAAAEGLERRALSRAVMSRIRGGRVETIIESMPSSSKQIFQYKEFAAELMQRMSAQGMKGEMVVLKSDTGYIWSEKLGRSITTNGDHVGVKVGNTVYDNMFPQGMPYNQWLYDLGVGFPKMQPPVVTPF